MFASYCPFNKLIELFIAYWKCLWNEIFDFDFFVDSDSFWGPEYGEHSCFWLRQLEAPFISLQKLRF